MLTSLLANAQLKNSLSINVGLVSKNTIGFNTNYAYISNNSNYEIGGTYSRFESTPIENIKTKFSTLTLNLGYLHNLVRSSDNSINILAGAGVFGGAETIEDNSKVTITSKGGFIGGVYGVGELNFYVSDNFAFNVRLQQNYNVKSTTGKTNPFIGAGLKFNF